MFVFGGSLQYPLERFAPIPTNSRAIYRPSLLGSGKICKVHIGASVEYRSYLEKHLSACLQDTWPRLIDWIVDHGAKRSGMCNMADIGKCDDLCMQIKECNFFTVTYASNCCYIHKTCINMQAINGFDTYSMNKATGSIVSIEPVGWLKVNITAVDGPQERMNHKSFIDSSLLYIVGGSGSNQLGDLWVYDILENAWVVGQSYAFNATSSSGPMVKYSNIIHFGPRSNELIAISLGISSGKKSRLLMPKNHAGAPSTRHFASMVRQNKSLYLFGGQLQNGAYTNDVWEASFLPVCDFSSEGTVRLATDCELQNEIVVRKNLEINGQEISPGVLPKIIGKNNRLFTIDGGGHFLARNVEFKSGKSVGLRVIGRCMGSEAGFENIGKCEPDSSAGQSVSVPDSLLEWNGEQRQSY